MRYRAFSSDKCSPSHTYLFAGEHFLFVLMASLPDADWNSFYLTPLLNGLAAAGRVYVVLFGTTHALGQAQVTDALIK